MVEGNLEFLVELKIVPQQKDSHPYVCADAHENLLLQTDRQILDMV